jgi:hypothetical protein
MIDTTDKQFKKKQLDFIYRKCLVEIEEIELSGETVTKNQVREILDNVSSNLGEKFSNLTDSDFKGLLFKLELQPIKVAELNRAVVVKGERVAPWLNVASVDWKLWPSYKELLRYEGKSEDVIRQHERVIDAALDMSGDPNQPGPWPTRKGLIMGNVQAGKTMNFIGLLNKSLDVGYYTVIILGGHMNELRKQAQIRVDEGLTGRDTSLFSRGTIPNNFRKIGVANIQTDDVESRPLSITSRNFDINRNYLNQRHDFGITPSVFVIKKNVGVMNALADWLEGFELSKGRHKPMILIDDEADYASINTAAQKNDIAATNKAIKRILGLFEKPTYVAYTATPFANVFIPYEGTVSGELDDDLFPSDFMLKMPIPPNYQGQDAFFPTNTTINDAPLVEKIVDIDDRTGWLPLKHKKDIEIDGLHPQLEEAICYFLCVIVKRFSKGETNCHNTMLVNVSRFNDVQRTVVNLIDEYLESLKKAVIAFGSLGVEMASSSSHHIKYLREVYVDKFKEQDLAFESVLQILSKNIARVKVEMVNGLVERTRDNPMSLNYEANDDNGLWVIAVGGLKLSRGLTLYGLSVSFFLRNAMAYDTLTQMCRWFGYHQGYEDFCKLYLLESSYEHYSTVAESIRELYKELRLMELSSGTPRDFGLKVLASDTALLITAKNKMGAGREFRYSYKLYGETIFFTRAFTDPQLNQKNYDKFEAYLSKLNSRISYQKKDGYSSYIYEQVSYDEVTNLLETLNNPVSSSTKNDKAALVRAFKALKKNNVKDPTLILFSRKTSGSRTSTKNLIDENGHPVEFDAEHKICGQSLNTIAKKLTIKKKQISSRNSTIGDKDDLRCLFDEEQIDNFLGKFKSNSESASIDEDNSLFKRMINAPVIMIYFVSAIVKADEDKFKIAHGETPTIMYALHFPTKEALKNHEGDTLNSIPEMGVNRSYIANEILQNLSIDDMTDEDQDE